MAALNAEIESSRPLGRWDSAFMVETSGGCERTRLEGCKEGPEPSMGMSVHFVATRLVQTSVHFVKRIGFERRCVFG